MRIKKCSLMSRAFSPCQSMKRIWYFMIFISGLQLVWFWQQFQQLSAEEEQYTIFQSRSSSSSPQSLANCTSNPSTLILKDTKWYTDKCLFLSDVESSPLPTILISRGRSGSTITWLTISSILGNLNHACEFTGSNSKESRDFFQAIETNPNIHSDWAVKRLCYIQNNQKGIDIYNPGIAGFKWKPSEWDSPLAEEARQELAKAGNVKFIYLVRNPLDHLTSFAKHTNARNSGMKLAAHCEKGDEKCIQTVGEYSTEITLPVGKKLLQKLKKYHKEEMKIEQDLMRYGMTFVKVKYHLLYDSTHQDDNAPAEEWMRIFKYLGRGPMYGLTMKNVKDHFILEETHAAKLRNETITNYNEVSSTLKGTMFEYLLNE